MRRHRTDIGNLSSLSTGASSSRTYSAKAYRKLHGALFFRRGWQKRLLRDVRDYTTELFRHEKECFVVLRVVNVRNKDGAADGKPEVVVSQHRRQIRLAGVH